MIKQRATCWHVIPSAPFSRRCPGKKNKMYAHSSLPYLQSYFHECSEQPPPVSIVLIVVDPALKLIRARTALAFVDVIAF